MHILWITEHYYPNSGGMAHSCDRIVRNLRDQGIKIDLVHLARKCRRRPIQKTQKGFDICWPLESEPAHGLNLLWNWLEARHASSDKSSDTPKAMYSAVVCFGAHYALIAARNFAAWLDRPLYTMIRGNDFDIAVFDPRKTAFIESVYRSSHAIICVSKDKQRKLKALHPSLTVEYVASGIDPQEWTVSDSHLKKAKTLIEPISGDKTIIGVFGHLKKKKGLEFFLRTLTLSAQQDFFHLLIVGELDVETQALISEYENTSNKPISFTHVPLVQRHELISYYLACDCIAIPSFYDGTPNVMLEASVLGIPIVAANVGGMNDILIDKKTALLFSPGNESELRKLFHTIPALEKSYLQGIGEAARKHILKHHTAGIEGSQYMKIFNDGPA